MGFIFGQKSYDFYKKSSKILRYTFERVSFSETTVSRISSLLLFMGHKTTTPCGGIKQYLISVLIRNPVILFILDIQNSSGKSTRSKVISGQTILNEDSTRNTQWFDS